MAERIHATAGQEPHLTQPVSQGESPSRPAIAPPGAPKRRDIPLWRKVIYAIVILIWALLGAEGLLRVRAWLKYGSTSPISESVIYRTDRKTGLTGLRRGHHVIGRETSININSLGFRGKEIAEKKPPRTIRIACLGASTTFCSEVSDDAHTWPARLEAMIQEKYPDVHVEVINVGVPGYLLEHTTKNLVYRVLPLEPDLVIDYEAINDVALDTSLLAMRAGIVQVAAGSERGFVAWAAEHSLLVDLLQKTLKLHSGYRGYQKRLAKLPDTLTAHFAKQLAKLHEELASRNIPLVMSTFLVKFRRDQSPEEQLANADVAFYYMPWLSVDQMLDALDRYNEAIVTYAKAHSIPVADDADAIPADSAHYRDCMHFTDAGCEKMAQRFMRLLVADGLLDKIMDKVKQ